MMDGIDNVLPEVPIACHREWWVVLINGILVGGYTDREQAEKRKRRAVIPTDCEIILVREVKISEIYLDVAPERR